MTTVFTSFNVGAVSATQYLYGALHVTADVFTSATVKIQSDATGAFSGAETDRITFGAVTGIDYEWATPVAGAITDAYWRAVVSAFSGTSMVYTVEMGIQ